MAERKPPGEKFPRLTFTFSAEVSQKLAELADDQAGGNKSLLLRRLIEAAAKVAPRRLDQIVDELGRKPKPKGEKP